MQGECQIAARADGRAFHQSNTSNPTTTMPVTAVTFDNPTPNPSTTSLPTGSKSSSIFGSRRLWGFKDNFLSGISSRLEALQSSFTETSSTTDPGPVQQQQPPPPPPSSSSASPVSSLNGSPSTGKQRRKPTKVRSIFGQPEMLLGNHPLQRSKDTSMDSLDTLDSGQSMGGSSCVSVTELRCLELHDALKPYRASGESIGIGSGQETSLESSEAEEETDHLHHQYHHHDSHRCREPSRGSVKSWTSSLNCESNDDDDEMIKKFMGDFVNKIFQDR